MNPTIRGALIPRLLQDRPWQLSELADHLGVSTAQLRRDLVAVRAAGWPIAEQGRPKFVWLDKGNVIEAQPEIAVGDDVRFRFGSRKVTARVIEDRGRIGVGGRRLLRISFNIGADKPTEFEMPAEELERITS